MEKIKNPKQIGIISENMVIAKLLSLGYKISVPIGDNYSYDIIIDHKVGFLKCQIKTARIRNNCVKLPLRRCRINTKGYYKSIYDNKEIDFFIGYCPDNEGFYFFPFKKCQLTTDVNFRIVKSKNNQSKGVRDAKYYEIQNMSAYLETGKVESPKFGEALTGNTEPSQMEGVETRREIPKSQDMVKV